MAITQTIQGPSVIPNRVTDTPEQFSVNAITSLTDQAAMGAQQNTYATQANALAVQVNADAATSGANAIIALNASNAAVGAANYKGNWEGKTGAGVIGESYLYKASFIYRLNVNLANLSTSVPSPTNTDWVFIQEVPFETPCKPTLDLDFENQDFTIYSPAEGFVKKPLTDIMDIARASSGTSINALGGITTLGSNLPRYEFDGEMGAAKGVLVEGSATNLLTWSEDFSDGVWGRVSGSTLEITTLTSPSGGAVYRFIETEDLASQGFFQTISALASTSYTRSFVVKPDQRDWVYIRQVDGSTTLGAWFNIRNGQIGTVQSGVVADIEPLKDGFFKCSVTFSTSASATLERAQISTVLNNGSTDFTGEGLSAFFVCDAQITATPYPVSYIKTEASTVTRAADNVTRVPGEELNSDEGTFIFKLSGGVNPSPISNFGRLYQISFGGPTLNQIYAIRRINLLYSFYVIADGVQQDSFNSVSISDLKTLAVTWSKSKNETKTFANGIQVTSGSFSGFTGSANLMALGSPSAGSGNIGSITFKNTKLYPRAFDALTLQRLTRIQ